MKHVFNSRSVLITLLALSTHAHAGLLPESEDDDEGLWRFSAIGLYADQSNNLPILYGLTALDSKAGLNSDSNPASELGDHVFADPEETFGFGGEIAYIFPEHLYDIRINYFGIYSDAHVNEVVDIPPFGMGEPFGINTDEAFNLTTAEIMFGQYFIPTENLTVRTSFGIAFADIEQKNHTTFPGIVEPGTSNNHFTNEFTGAGPKGQVDATYDLIESLAVIGNLGLAALWGDAEIDAHLLQTGTEDSDFNSEYNDSTHQVSLAVNSKLGLLFSPEISDDWMVNIEAGYQVVAYLNALQEDNIQLPIDGGALLFESEGDYSYSGPYVQLGMDF